MTLKKNNLSQRGVYKMAISEQFGIGAVQWIDSKVVNCVSSVLDFTEQKIYRQIGPNKEEFSCPGMMVLYQENLSGVDRIDQMRIEGLASVSHFKKWYKKALFAVIDMMLLNGLHLWNKVCEKDPRKKKLKKHEYLRVIANCLLRYKTRTWMSPMRVGDKSARKKTHFAESVAPVEGREGITDKVDDGKETRASKRDARCLVCSLESSQYARVWEQQKNMVKDEEENKSMQEKVRKACLGCRRVVSCCCNCEVNAHSTVFDKGDRKKIHDYFPPNMSCMDILHSPFGKEIWSIQRDHSGNCLARVRTRHRVVRELNEEIAADLGVIRAVGEKITSGGQRKRKAD